MVFEFKRREKKTPRQLIAGGAQYSGGLTAILWKLYPIPPRQLP
jgi:hypothetical protein